MARDPEKEVLSLRNVTRHYDQGSERLLVLDDISFSLKPSETLALVGPSGCGKSTLLHIAALLDTPQSGTVDILGKGTQSVSDRRRTMLRRKYLGFIYQFHHLLAEFSALENVMMPMQVSEIPLKEASQKAQALLEEVGLAHRMHHLPAELSGGEQQRVAIARALANDPAILLADEPTGNLDAVRSEEIFDLILRLAQQRGMAAIVATHNPDLARRLRREMTLQRGRLQAVR